MTTTSKTTLVIDLTPAELMEYMRRIGEIAKALQDADTSVSRTTAAALVKIAEMMLHDLGLIDKGICPFCRMEKEELDGRHGLKMCQECAKKLDNGDFNPPPHPMLLELGERIKRHFDEEKLEEMLG